MNKTQQADAKLMRPEEITLSETEMRIIVYLRRIEELAKLNKDLRSEMDESRKENADIRTKAADWMETVSNEILDLTNTLDAFMESKEGKRVAPKKKDRQFAFRNLKGHVDKLHELSKGKPSGVRPFYKWVMKVQTDRPSITTGPNTTVEGVIPVGGCSMSTTEKESAAK